MRLPWRGKLPPCLLDHEGVEIQTNGTLCFTHHGGLVLNAVASFNALVFPSNVG